MAYGSLAYGLLTVTITRSTTFDTSDRRASSSSTPWPPDRNQPGSPQSCERGVPFSSPSTTRLVDLGTG